MLQQLLENGKRLCNVKNEKIRKIHGTKAFTRNIDHSLSHPKLVDRGESTELVNEFREIVAKYMVECINPIIELMNSVNGLPKDEEERLEALRNKYNYFANQFNDYVKRCNKEMSQQLDGIENISKRLVARIA